jgi:hypothetical protein
LPSRVKRKKRLISAQKQRKSNFTAFPAYVTLLPHIMVKKLFSFACLVLMLAGSGCQTTQTTITNLTPKREYRSQNGTYAVEAALNSRQQTMRWDTVKASVMVGNEFYPMRQTALMTNRWETLIPIPPGAGVISYRFKFDYDYNAFGAPPKADSKLSPVYKFQIMDR